VLRRRATLTLAAVLAVAAAVQLAPLPQPLLLSRDAYAYWAYGRIAAVDGGNPYRDAPNRYPNDPAYHAMSGAWHDRTSVYGPLFTLASEGGARAVGRSPEAAAVFYKSLAALGMLVVVVLAASLSRRPVFTTAAVGWNPLLAVHFAGGGHNDVWMIAGVLAALALEARGRVQLGGALWALAAAVKWIPLLLVPLRAVHRPRFGLRGFVVAIVLVSLVSTLRYGDEFLSAFLPIAQDLRAGARTSIVHRLQGLGVPPLAVLAAFAVAYLGLLWRAARGRLRLGLTTGLLLVATPWLLPWYVSWALPLAAAEDDAVALVLAVGLSGYLLQASAF
jgi:alpha-1,6-mannosyltransferase